ncbi:surface protease GP63 [Trypanosoma theileri]|uniref:leishmanolysin n=1 Tax=Trypanosoma theileri TaxID=67003 RepID=A0A1X0NFL1_9TRYP|nr:surface protease GP63 [Trypanosoma theileri]ORC83447.1 surface protease GP63 [Trypanosoma theileri]
MRRLLCTALLLLCCAYGCIAAVVQPLPQTGQGPWDTYTVAVTGEPDLEKKKEFKPIRFAVSAKEIDRVLAYCNRYEEYALDEVQDEILYGFKLDVSKHWDDFCEKVENEVTPEKKKKLLREVLPAALKLHSERLSVKHEDKLALTSENKDSYPVLPNCSGVSIPKEHLSGISDADFMLYVGLTDEYVPVQICSKNAEGRPTSALIKFVPKEIAVTRHFIRFTAHEVAHALGFETETMMKHGVIEENPGGDKKVPLVKSTTVIKEMKEHYGCSDDKCDDEIKKVAFENEPSKDAPLHWERRIAKDELMSTYTPDLDVTGAYYTSLTLAVFDSMPFYKASFDMAENMSWGKDAGCDFLKGGDEKKDEIIQKHNEMFCKRSELILECTSDRFALGRCTKDIELKGSPFEYAYFNHFFFTETDERELMDGYPFIKPIDWTNCENGRVNLMPGSFVGSESRCLKGENLELKEEREEKVTVRGICADVKCDDGKVKVKYNGSEIWHICTDDEKINVENSPDLKSGGSIFCPKYSEVCNEKKNNATEFPIVYDKDERERMDKEDKEEEEKQRKEADRKKKEEEEERGRAEELLSPLGSAARAVEENVESPVRPAPRAENGAQDSSGSKSGALPHKEPLVMEEEKKQKVEQQGQQSPRLQSIPKEEPSARSDVLPKNEKDSHETSKVRNQSGAPGVNEQDVATNVRPSSVVNEKNPVQISSSNNDNEVSQQQPPGVAQKNPSDSKTPEVEKMPDSKITIPAPYGPSFEAPKPVVPESTVVTVEPTPSIKEDKKNNTAENTKQVHGTSSQSTSQGGKNDERNTTVDPTHHPNSTSPDNEKNNETIVNTDNKTTTSTDPVENAQTETSVTGTPSPTDSNNTDGHNINSISATSPVNEKTAAADPATLTGLNTQMGQVMNHTNAFAVVGADSSIATSYQITLLLLLCALVALASP